jgi:transglutaminase-like putative cysteine protease
MGWRIRVVHETGYQYNAPVHESYNEVRLTPRSDGHQNVIVNRLETVPVAVGRDYDDVSPIKGIYSGGSAEALDVTVDMTRLA